MRYRRNGGYKAIEKALNMSPDEVIQAVKDSGLRDQRAWRDWIKHFIHHRGAGRKNKTCDGVSHGAFG